MGKQQWIGSGAVVAALWAGACSLTSDLDITGGDTGTGGVGGYIATGGAGGEAAGPVSCTSVTDCPQVPSPCEAPVCLANLCGSVAEPSGEPVRQSEQELGDCLLTVCDGAGSSLDQNDDTDAPADTQCTSYTCLSGVLVPTQRDLGIECTDGICDGEGLCAECVIASDCVDLPPSGECGQRACNANACEMVHTADGTPVEAQTEGDCKLRVCDGQGGLRDEVAPADLPDDGNPCTENLCSGAVPDHPVLLGNPVCPAGNCNDSGQCVGCTQPEQCGDDTECLAWSCGAGEVCEVNYVEQGVVVSTGQEPGDCQRIVCDGNGGMMTEEDPADPPPDDGIQCTDETCVDGSPQNPPRPLDHDCTQDGGDFCDGEGACVECNSHGQCGASTQCQLAQCESHACSMVYAVPGTPVSPQMPWDCQIRVCDGMGGIHSIPQDTDLPLDGDPCTDDECHDGVPSNPPTAAGVSCGSGNVCDGQGNCVPCVTDAHCLGNQHCSNYQCVSDYPVGHTCSRGQMCSSGYCVDGFCCDDRCHLVCEACSAAKTGRTDGACEAVLPLTDPDEECAGEAVCLDVMSCCFHQGYGEPGQQPQGDVLMGPCP